MLILSKGCIQVKAKYRLSTEVTYEDGRKGSISADLELRDVTLATEKVKAA